MIIFVCIQLIIVILIESESPFYQLNKIMKIY